MSEKHTETSSELNRLAPRSLGFLNPSQIQMIDEALSALGEYGEVRLVVEKGRLRFVVTQDSHDALRWQPGSMKRKGAD